MLTALAKAGNTANVFSSYVNADPTAFDTNLTYNFNVYVNAWVDVVSEKAQAAIGKFVSQLMHTQQSIKLQTALYTNAFATAGFIAMKYS